MKRLAACAVTIAGVALLLWGIREYRANFPGADWWSVGRDGLIVKRLISGIGLMIVGALMFWRTS